jgi:predicted ABC-type ATPase
MRPRLTILGGPNGAGKTTLAKSSYVELLENDRFLNAAEFAADLAPDSPADRGVPHNLSNLN